MTNRNLHHKISQARALSLLRRDGPFVGSGGTTCCPNAGAAEAPVVKLVPGVAVSSVAIHRVYALETKGSQWRTKQQTCNTKTRQQDAAVLHDVLAFYRC